MQILLPMSLHSSSPTPKTEKPQKQNCYYSTTKYLISVDICVLILKLSSILHVAKFPQQRTRAQMGVFFAFVIESQIYIVLKDTSFTNVRKHSPLSYGYLLLCNENFSRCTHFSSKMILKIGRAHV